MRPVILFDMDGVLADFVGGALRVHGKYIHPGEVGYNFWTQVGFDGDAGAKAFWALLANPGFWANLDPLPDGMELFERVRGLVSKDRIGLLSSGFCPGSPDGKAEWVRKHLPGFERRLYTGADKHLLAAPHIILIEDYEANVEAWQAAGGKAVLVPRSWNRRRGETLPGNTFRPAALAGEIADLLRP